MEKKYYIKEVADIIGVTRDTLRVYEEEGLITPERDKNDFRVYSKQDIYKLIAIRFHRTNDLSLKDIRSILNQEDTNDIMEVIRQQIAVEESILAVHKKNIRRLNMAKYYYRDKPDSLCIEEGTMESAYIISDEYSDFFDTIKAFFKLAKKDSDYVMSFLNVEYDIKDSIDNYRSSYILLNEDEINALRRADLMEIGKKLPGGECIRYLFYSKEPIPERKHLENVIKYADEHAVKLTGRIYAHFLYQFETKNGTEFLIEMLAEKQ